jgi:excisionase family DNA binding protein
MTPMMTKKEVAAYLHVSTSTVDRLTAKRLLPFVVVGGRRRFRENDILYYIASRSFGHPADLSTPHPNDKEIAHA